MTGAVVKTVSSTTMLDRLTQRYGLKLLETPIGFKYIAQLMMTEDIMIGGEESGGVGFRGHVPERDATLMALYLVEMMAMRGQTMAGLLAELRERVGAHAYDRIDVLLRQPVTPAQFAALRGAVPTAMAGVALADINAKDGLKLLMADGSWLLLRASGTEPVLRIYAEGSTPEQVRAYLDAGLALATGVGIEQAPRR
jgi:phosphomannomutase